MEHRVEGERKLKIGTRGSALALWQAETVQGLLSVATDLVIIKTEGDLRLDIALQGGTATGFFTKDIERRLIDGEVDIAVHSLKDLPTQCDERLDVIAFLPRGPVQDRGLEHKARRHKWTQLLREFHQLPHAQQSEYPRASAAVEVGAAQPWRAHLRPRGIRSF